MMLWKNLKAGTIVDACVGMSRKRAERIEAAGQDTGRPATDRQPDPEAGKAAPESIQPAE